MALASLMGLKGVGIIKLFIGVNCGRKFMHKVPMEWFVAGTDGST